jgi:hypothetical protein
MKKLILAALMVCVVSPAWGGTDSRYTSFGYKKLGSCGLFVKENRSGISNEFTGWIRGFMTATNKFVSGKTDFFEGTDEDSIFLWIEQWCLKNPTSSFGRGLHLFLKTRGVPLPQ